MQICYSVCQIVCYTHTGWTIIGKQVGFDGDGKGWLISQVFHDGIFLSISFTDTIKRLDKRAHRNALVDLNVPGTAATDLHFVLVNLGQYDRPAPKGAISIRCQFQALVVFLKVDFDGRCPIDVDGLSLLCLSFDFFADE